MSPVSIHRRLNRRLLTGIAAMLVIFGAALGWLFVSELTRELDRSLESKARAFAGVGDNEKTGEVHFSDIVLPDGRKGRQVHIDFGRPATAASPQEAATQVIASEPRSVLLWTTARYSLTLAALFGILLLAQALLVRNVLRRGLEPIVGLKRQLETLHPGHRGQRVSLQSPPEELAPILRRINDILANVEPTLPERRRAAR